MFKCAMKKLGVGINYRNEYASDILKCSSLIDFVEVNTERLFNSPLNPLLNEIMSIKPVVLHGLSLSLGTKSEPDLSQKYLDNLGKSILMSGCQWFSEHLAVTKVDDVELRALMPITFSFENVKLVSKKIKTMTSAFKKPFLLENITYYYSMPDNEMSEIDFFKSVIESSDCGILLDLNNLFVNSLNHNYDAYHFIDQLPLERIFEVHLAGCDYMHDLLIDTHASSIKEQVIDLFKYLCKKTTVYGVVIERDDKLDAFDTLMNEVNTIRNIYNKYCCQG